MIPYRCYCQDTDTGAGFQMIVMNNPSFPGSEGDGKLRLSYLNFSPGNHYNLHLVYVSYDSYFPALHGGAGFYITDEYMGGIINDLRGGLSYAYFLRAGSDLYINAGLSASFLYRGYNFSGAVFPDQIDPLGGVSLPSSMLPDDKGRTVFDVGAGFLFMKGRFFGGIAVNHLSEPQLYPSESQQGRLRRKLLVHISADLDLLRSGSITLQPVSFVMIQGGVTEAGFGTVINSRYLSLNIVFQGDNNRNINLLSGFSLKSGRIDIFYNYRFTLFPEERLLPASLYHQTGLVFSLNNVDKRNDINTINFPKM